MPADIRNFFGGKGAPPKSETAPKPVETKKRRGNARIIEDDSDDEAPPPKKATPKKSAPKKSVKDSPKGEITSTSDYFASSGKAKPSRTIPAKAKKEEAVLPMQTTPKKKLNASATPLSGGRTSSRKRGTKVSYAEASDEEGGGADDIFADEQKSTNGRKDDYMDVNSDSDEAPVPKKGKSNAGSPLVSRKKCDAKTKEPAVDVMMSEDESLKLKSSAAKSRKQISGQKRKSLEVEEEDSEEFEPPRKQVKGKTTEKSPAKGKRAPATNAADRPEDPTIKAIMDNIPLVKAPSPPPKDPDAKPSWRGGGNGGNAGPPLGVGSKEIPTGEENCLTGLTFVFTGLLESLQREEGIELVKRYGGKITGAPSSKTNFVVLGTDAGPSKLVKIKKMNIRTINEDGLFKLIRDLPANGGSGKSAEKSMEKKLAEEAKIRKDAADMEKEEQKKAAEAEREARRLAAARGLKTPTSSQVAKAVNSELLTVKYAPTSMNQVCGNKSQVEKIQAWLRNWPKAHKYNFQKRGADGLGGARAILIFGPPGIGKTTAAHLAAKLEGYDAIESNASDTRSKKLVESGLSDVLNNSSLLGFFAADGKKVDEQKKKIVLIMDEVDGMSAGDRGGVGALAKICKKTDIPIILICNERKQPKMRPFDDVTLDLPFRRPTVEQVRSRIATICLREGLKLPMPIIDALIEGSNKDIRQIINMISTAKLDQTAMDFDQGKSMIKAWEKHVILKPWDICHKLLGSGMFAPSSKATLNDKIELYFNDHEFSYLMIQENYLSTKPLRLSAGNYTARQQRLKNLELIDNAAESISDGDLVDRMIHGSQQQWSLMPTHAVFSTVRPADYISGAMMGQTAFTSWLGNNSKQGKLSRYVKEIQSHMRLRCSADRHEIRQQYLPVLWTELIQRMEAQGKECVEEVVDLMDSYFLTREDWDSIMELGLGPQNEKNVKLDSQTKAAFTRTYNSRSHPMPFMKASNVFAPQKVVKAAPDLEEAIEDDENDIAMADEKEDTAEDDAECDLSKDKYIKKPKAKKAAAKPAAKKGKDAKKGKSK